LSEGRHDPSSDIHTSFGSLHRGEGFRQGDVVGFVLRRGLQGEQALQIFGELRSIISGLTEQSDRLPVVVACCSLVEAGTANRVRGVDSSVDGQAGGGDAAFRFQFGIGSEEELLGLGQVLAHLDHGHRSGLDRLSHLTPI